LGLNAVVRLAKGRVGDRGIDLLVARRRGSEGLADAETKPTPLLPTGEAEREQGRDQISKLTDRRMREGDSIFFHFGSGRGSTP